jgi:diguanylate cyclase (GGDEF)-like protein
LARYVHNSCVAGASCFFLMSIVARLLTRFALLLTGIPLAAAAVPPQRPIDLFDIGAPSFTTFSTRDGLPAWVMSGVQVDGEGFVWASSAQGLARYDGHRWEAAGPIAAVGTLGALMTDHQGTLWAAFRDRGIAHFDGREWHFETGLPSQSVRQLVETVDTSGQHELWALTFGAGLLKYDSGQWRVAPGDENLPRMVICLARTHDLLGHERLWLGTGNDGLMYRDDGGPWQRFDASGFNGYQIEGLLVARRGDREELWISTFGAGLWRLDDSGLRGWSVATGDLASNELYGLAQSSLPGGDHAIWAASRDGLVRVHGDSVRVFDRQYGLPSNVVRGLNVWRSPDGVDVLWLATENGIARTIAGVSPWQIASLMGSRSSGVFGVLVEPDGAGGERLWTGAEEDGLARYQDHAWRHFTAADGIPAPSARMIKRARDERGDDALWLGLQGGQLARMRGETFQTIAVPWDTRASQAVTDILGRQFDGSHEVWAATRMTGLYRLRNGTWTPMRPAGVPAEWSTTAIAEQMAAGRSWLWITSSHGLARYDGKEVTLFGDDIGLPDRNLLGISLITEAGRPVLWLGSGHAGIERVDVSDPMHPVVLPKDDLPPAPDPTAYSALRDSRGRIYICTNNGVQQLTPAANGYASRVFTRRDGVLHDECNTNGQFIDAHDRFWTGMLGGLAVYDPARERTDRQPKPLKITGVRIDGESANGDSVTVQPGQREVSVQFALLSWQGEEKSAFRSQLVGYEADPGAWTQQNSRDFSHLPPGIYTLRVEARDYAGNLSEPLQIAITVLPAWWQTVWARAAIAFAFAWLLYVLLQWRTRTLQARQHQLETLVSARTAELNEVNARLLELSYKDVLTGLANRRRMLEMLEELPARPARTPTTLIFVDVDYFKAYNDDFGHPAGDEALRGVAAAMRACVPVGALVARYGGEEFACLLPATGIERAREVAEHIRTAVAELDIPVPGTQKINRVTISAGAAEHVIASAADAHLLLRDADIALYQAKRSGRNCVRG